MSVASAEYRVEQSILGRIVVPDRVPAGFALFYTTSDFDGRLNGGHESSMTGIVAVIRERFGLDAMLATCSQVHGRRVERARREDGWRECDGCDALWSNDPGVAIAIKGADCLPVTIIDDSSGVIANIHSGWRGAAQRITDETVAALRSSSSFSADRAFVFLGPSIRACCFEVGEEVVEQFAASYPGVEQYVERSRTRPHLDIAGLTAGRLAALGFRPEHVLDSGLCTRCEGSIFHSYRRDGPGGRNLAVVAR